MRQLSRMCVVTTKLMVTALVFASPAFAGNPKAPKIALEMQQRMKSTQDHMAAVAGATSPSKAEWHTKWGEVEKEIDESIRKLNEDGYKLEKVVDSTGKISIKDNSTGKDSYVTNMVTRTNEFFEWGKKFGDQIPVTAPNVAALRINFLVDFYVGTGLETSIRAIPSSLIYSALGPLARGTSDMSSSAMRAIAAAEIKTILDRIIRGDAEAIKDLAAKADDLSQHMAALKSLDKFLVSIGLGQSAGEAEAKVMLAPVLDAMRRGGGPAETALKLFSLLDKLTPETTARQGWLGEFCKTLGSSDPQKISDLTEVLNKMLEAAQDGDTLPDLISRYRIANGLAQTRESDEELNNYAKNQTPLAIELEPGAESPFQSGWILFDISGERKPLRIHPLAPNWGWLMVDRDGDGAFSGGEELFGTGWFQKSLGNLDGFMVLNLFDQNRDDRIDSSDPIYKRIFVWRDQNGNGVSEEEELFRLADLGVEVIEAKPVHGSFFSGDFEEYSIRAPTRSIARGKNRVFQVLDFYFNEGNSVE